MRNISKLKGRVFHTFLLLIIAFLGLGLFPSKGKGQLTSNDDITLLKPLNGAVFASRAPPTFLWESTDYGLFKVQFSEDLNFPRNKTLTIPASDSSLTPSLLACQVIKGMENQKQIVHWRVMGKDGEGSIVYSEVRSFFITSNPPINNKLVNIVDVNIPGRGISTQLTRTYLLDSSYYGPLGYKWTHFYNMNLNEYTDGLIKIFNQDGTESFFKPNGNGGYLALPGDFRTLTKNSEGTFHLREKTGLVYIFDADGKLISIVDPNGNQIILNYNNEDLLSTVTDPSGRVTTFNYNNDKLIESITDPIGRVIQYEYDNLGNLIRQSIQQVIKPSTLVTVDIS